LSLSWVRRSRIDGSDFWADPPLGEGVHRFRVEIGPEAAPLVSVDVDGAETVTGLDVSGVSGPQEVRIAQVSEIYGPGPAARLTLTF
ncbi:MAG: hypothetical protein AAGK57_14105, partial [Pseudomonadota bacterium]